MNAENRDSQTAGVYGVAVADSTRDRLRIPASSTVQKTASRVTRTTASPSFHRLLLVRPSGGCADTGKAGGVRPSGRGRSSRGSSTRDRPTVVVGSWTA